MTAPYIQSYDEYRKALADSDKPVFIEFTASWCPPCRVITPIYESLASSHDSEQFYKCDVDEQVEISQENNIRAMPTFVVFSGGQEVDRILGADPSKLVRLVEKYAATVPEAQYSTLPAK